MAPPNTNMSYRFRLLLFVRGSSLFFRFISRATENGFLVSLSCRDRPQTAFLALSAFSDPLSTPPRREQRRKGTFLRKQQAPQESKEKLPLGSRLGRPRVLHEEPE